MEWCLWDTLLFVSWGVFCWVPGANLSSGFCCKSKCDGSGHALAWIGKHHFLWCSTVFLQSWFESIQELLHIQQLPELMSPSTHTIDFSGFFFFPPVSSFRDILYTSYRKGKIATNGWGQAHSPDCTCPLPCSHQQPCPFHPCLHKRTLFLVKGWNLHTSCDTQPGCSNKAKHYASVCISLSSHWPFSAAASPWRNICCLT